MSFTFFDIVGEQSGGVPNLIYWDEFQYLLKDEQEYKCGVGHVNHPTLIQSSLVASTARRAVTDKYIISQQNSLRSICKVSNQKT